MLERSCVFIKSVVANLFFELFFFPNHGTTAEFANFLLCNVPKFQILDRSHIYSLKLKTD